MASPALSTSSERTMVAEKDEKSFIRHLSPFQLIRLIGSLAVSIALSISSFLYLVYQSIIGLLFTAPYIPLAPGVRPRGRIAIIGAGITGISSAAHLVSHGFEVVIFDQAAEIGGIWANVNSTSSLQLNSIMYRFHPSVKWRSAYPRRDEIIEQITRLFNRYHLAKSTRPNFKVKSVTRHPRTSTSPSKGGHARWLINEDDSLGVFDAVIGSVGTCGPRQIASILGSTKFNGEIYHSSRLDNIELRNKKLVIIGSGASAIEAADLGVANGAKEIVVLARDDKWIIPRNTAFDIALALKPYGAQTRLSWIPEKIIRYFHYGSASDLSPAHRGLFEGTPIVNNKFLKHIKSGKVEYRRGDTLSITAQGVKFNERARGTLPGEKGEEGVITGDIICLATGYEKPSVGIFPSDLFPTEGKRHYQRPNLYLQNFSTEDCSILLTNSAYKHSIGSVGNWHIGIYARILMVFLLEEKSRPTPAGMKLWVDLIGYLKVSTFGEEGEEGRGREGLDFFTYSELVVWIVAFHAFRISRLKWLPFVLFGWGLPVPTPPRRGISDFSF